MTRQPNLDTPAARCFYATRPAERPHCQLTAVIQYGTIALCTDCDTRRSTLGKGQPGHPLPPTTPTDALTRISQADTAVRTAQTKLADAVQKARQHGHSWTTIGDQLHISRQAAQQRFRQDLHTPG